MHFLLTNPACMVSNVFSIQHQCVNLSLCRLRSFPVIARNLLAILFALCIGASAQTADEIIAKNIAARGGLEKLKAIQSSRVTSTIDQGGFRATVIQANKRSNMLCTTLNVGVRGAVCSF